MKEIFVQFKSGKTLDVKDICDYVESQDFDIVVSRGDKKEAHVTIFHDAVEYMSVMDDISDLDDFYMTEINKFDKRPIVKGGLTNQEAIERIQSIKSKVSLYDDVMALRMAEEALEKENKE